MIELNSRLGVSWLADLSIRLIVSTVNLTMTSVTDNEFTYIGVTRERWGLMDKSDTSGVLYDYPPCRTVLVCSSVDVFMRRGRSVGS